MKTIFSEIFLVSILFTSCQKTNIPESSITQNQNIEIKFIKNGELFLKNGNILIKKLDVELATNNAQWSQGLMYRSFMDENFGMLFIFDKSEKSNFWMKNTRIPLDIIYIKEDCTVLNIARDVPAFSENMVTPSKGPVKFVLEVNGGMADKWGIKEGITKIYLKENYTH